MGQVFHPHHLLEKKRLNKFWIGPRVAQWQGICPITTRMRVRIQVMPQPPMPGALREGGVAYSLSTLMLKRKPIMGVSELMHAKDAERANLPSA